MLRSVPGTRPTQLCDRAIRSAFSGSTDYLGGSTPIRFVAGRDDTVEKGFMRVAPPAPVRKGFLNHCQGCSYEPSTAIDRNWILSDHISSVVRSTFSTASTRSGPGGCGPVAMQQSDATDAENVSLARISSAPPIKRREFYPLVQETCRESGVHLPLLRCCQIGRS